MNQEMYFSSEPRKINGSRRPKDGQKHLFRCQLYGYFITSIVLCSMYLIGHQEQARRHMREAFSSEGSNQNPSFFGPPPPNKSKELFQQVFSHGTQTVRQSPDESKHIMVKNSIAVQDSIEEHTSSLVAQKCHLDFWRKTISKQREIDENDRGDLDQQYLDIFTTHTRLSLDFFAHKKILDIGCGPQGSLEWAAATASAITCVDPLAMQIGDLGGSEHNMTYIVGTAENLPFPSHSYDIVSSINSLDHVSDLHRTLKEIARVLRKGGTFILYVEIHSETSSCIRQSMSFQMARKILGYGFVVDWRRDSESKNSYCRKRGVKASWECPPFNHNDNEDRPGYLALRATKL